MWIIPYDRNVFIISFNILYFKKENYLLIGTFLTGLFIQVLITSIPLFNTIFKTVSLNISEWITILLISINVLLIHEVLLKKKN